MAKPQPKKQHTDYADETNLHRFCSLKIFAKKARFYKFVPGPKVWESYHTTASSTSDCAGFRKRLQIPIVMVLPLRYILSISHCLQLKYEGDPKSPRPLLREENQSLEFRLADPCAPSVGWVGILVVEPNVAR